MANRRHPQFDNSGVMIHNDRDEANMTLRMLPQLHIGHKPDAGLFASSATFPMRRALSRLGE